MPPVIAKLAREILRDPLTVQVGRRSAPAVGITQAAYPVPEHLKASLLRHLLRNTEMPSVLVFTRTKVSARRLARAISADGFSVTELHSNLTQPQRNRAMEGFRRGDFQVLVATNIAARGGWTWSTSRTSSVWTCRRCRRTMSTASAARAGPRRRGTPSCWSRPPRRRRWRRSSGTSGSGCRG